MEWFYLMLVIILENGQLLKADGLAFLSLHTGSRCDIVPQSKGRKPYIETKLLIVTEPNFKLDLSRLGRIHFCPI